MSGDAELIRAAARGDRRAFDDLVSRKREMVVRVAYQVTGNLADAQDVAQGVFLSLWRSLDRFDARRALDTWLYRITVNASIDHLRAAGVRGRGRTDPLDAAGHRLASPEDSSVSAEIRALRGILRNLAARLAPKQRAAFLLREVEGLATAQVADILQVSESTVRNHVLHARRLLRRALLDEYPEYVPGGHRVSDAVQPSGAPGEPGEEVS